MNKRVTVVAGLALLVAGFSFGTLVSTTIAGESDEMSEEAVMQKWMEYATPGEQHTVLAKSEGKWNIAGTSWEYPGAEAQKSTMTSEVKGILGGRFFMEHVKGSFEMGEHTMPFEGRGLTGFDNLQQKYVFSWVDTFMTGIMTGEGTSPNGGTTITFFSENMPNPITGGFDKTKMVSERVSDDEFVSTFYRKAPDGKWFRHMELVYKRAQ